MKTNRHLFFTFVIVLAVLLLGSLIPFDAVLGQDGSPQTDGDAIASPDAVDARPAPALTYQGNLKRGGSAYTGICDFQFSLWAKVSGGSQIGLTQNSTGVEVTDGLFTSLLVFGFENDFIVGGENRFIQTKVKCPGDSDYTTLTPRQAIRPAASALTLQPGATVIDRSLSTGVDALYVVQTTANSQAVHGKGTADGSIGVWGEGVDSTGVYGLSQGGTGVWGASTDANTVGVKGVANAAGSVGVWGQSAANTGVYGQSGSVSGAALWGTNTAGGIALKAEGNAVQSLDMNGLPKAMALVEASTITRCYNGITGATTNGCGFSIVWNNQGTYGDDSNSVVNFGFNIANRFIVATPIKPTGIDVNWVFQLRSLSGNTASFLNWVCLGTPDCSGVPLRGSNSFFVVVY